MNTKYCDLIPRPDPNWREKAVIFLKMQGISKEDLKEGKNLVEKISVDEFFNTSKSVPKDDGTFRVGKYKGKTYEWAEKYDPRYYAWYKENVLGNKGGNV